MNCFNVTAFQFCNYSYLDLDLFVGYMSDQDLKKGQKIPYKIVPQFANLSDTIKQCFGAFTFVQNLETFHFN